MAHLSSYTSIFCVVLLAVYLLGCESDSVTGVEQEVSTSDVSEITEEPSSASAYSSHSIQISVHDPENSETYEGEIPVVVQFSIAPSLGEGEWERIIQFWCDGSSAHTIYQEQSYYHPFMGDTDWFVGEVWDELAANLDDCTETHMRATAAYYPYEPWNWAPQADKEDLVIYREIESYDLSVVIDGPQTLDMYQSGKFDRNILKPGYGAPYDHEWRIRFFHPNTQSWTSWSHVIGTDDHVYASSTSCEASRFQVSLDTWDSEDQHTIAYRTVDITDWGC